ncbi:hypothetical protein [Cytobacillus sp. IB215665]|uniref:hypothetical protein n=1 Tax=Cytobacillus sp. IB215665 TaxID=3097357 RepID=UPI002A11BC56|nr:hypothetical protein [Cytobacillus sp. IB215665]MDX8364698.1 hypothetical protein [Cytobacillus sp. IB215665]
MERYLFLFGIIVLGFSGIYFVMNFIVEYDGGVLIMSVLGMLNASIAIGVSEILSKIKNIKH